MAVKIEASSGNLRYSTFEVSFSKLSRQFLAFETRDLSVLDRDIGKESKDAIR